MSRSKPPRGVATKAPRKTTSGKQLPNARVKKRAIRKWPKNAKPTDVATFKGFAKMETIGRRVTNMRKVTINGVKKWASGGECRI